MTADWPPTLLEREFVILCMGCLLCFLAAVWNPILQEVNGAQPSKRHPRLPLDRLRHNLGGSPACR